ncbi:disease resistance protein Pik-2-like [Phragmites australis]|uniref:disease resistance protein Pik-2-like n=1 Tax=Phragmites australis TaxID=29695 RepID=UPI002D767092|nr:disease resistance protein Pik-2-like [Phragmites australis]
MESNPTLEGMKHIVTLSYNHLPHGLKGCMMYLSIFPEDNEINKDRLLRRWIAKGLVPEKRGLTPMEVAESYLDELVSRNMVVPHFGYDGKVESCRVHDMLLEVMVSKSLECNFISLLGGQYAAMSYDRIRRLSVQGDDDMRPQGAQQHKKKMTGQGIGGMDVEHDFCNDEVLVVRKNHNFPVLSNLIVTYKRKMPRVFQFEQGSMARLEILQIGFSNADQSIVGIEHLTKLKEVQLGGNNDSHPLHRALDQLKAENRRRPQSNLFQVVVKYD